MNALCRHFGPCGGCISQDVPQAEYLAHKRETVLAALARNGIEDVEVREPITVPPHTRRRAALKCAKANGAVTVGFYARQTHDIVDMQECRLLTPRLFAAIARLREMMSAMLREGDKAEFHLTDTDTGIDLAIDWKYPIRPALSTELAHWAQNLKLARIAVGRDIAVELARPQIAIGPARVAVPPKAFLQPTREGEAALQHLATEALAGAKNIADLFAGCGTFTFALAPDARVHAVEQDKPLLDALAEAVRHTQGLKPLTTERRDLFKLPLTPPELARFDAILLDPPRAGAPAQAKQLGPSKIRRVAYVSCNAQSFARDARILIAAGFRMGAITPVDQFLWSDHVELVARFSRR
jgi:23S rRNA (uracil1939-C5)-methyltransferase